MNDAEPLNEWLSHRTATGSTGVLPGSPSVVRLTRAELEGLLRDPVDGVLGDLENMLQSNNVHPTEVAALVTVGGGARIPYVTHRLSEALRVPVTTTPQAPVIAAAGAALIALRGVEEEVATSLATAAPRIPETSAPGRRTANPGAYRSRVPSVRSG